MQAAHGHGVLKEFVLNIRWEVIPLHDDCGA